MKITEIAKMPTTLEDSDGKIHESLLRSYHIVKKVIELLETDTPGAVILEMIEVMQQRNDNILRPKDLGG